MAYSMGIQSCIQQIPLCCIIQYKHEYVNLSSTQTRNASGVYELKCRFNTNLISQYNTQTRRLGEYGVQWVLVTREKGQRYRPLINVFLGGVGSLLPSRVYTDIPCHAECCICAVNKEFNIQPFRHLFLDRIWLFLEQKGLIFGLLFLYLDIGIRFYSV